MKTKVILSIALVILVSATTLAQENEKRFGVEFNGEISFVTTDLSGASLNTGLGFETLTPLNLGILFQFF